MRSLKNLNRIEHLRPWDALDISRAYLYLLLAGWRLFIRRDTGNRWVRSSLKAVPEEMSLSEELKVKRAAHWVNGAARVPVPWARCLQRCMALCMWMERRGLSPTLRVGVRRTATGIDAHSWVEINGQVINDDAAVRDVFTQFNTSHLGEAITAQKSEQPGTGQ